MQKHPQWGSFLRNFFHKKKEAARKTPILKFQKIICYNKSLEKHALALLHSTIFYQLAIISKKDFDKNVKFGIIWTLNFLETVHLEKISKKLLWVEIDF